MSLSQKMAVRADAPHFPQPGGQDAQNGLIQMTELMREEMLGTQCWLLSRVGLQDSSTFSLPPSPVSAESCAPLPLTETQETPSQCMEEI